MILEAVLVRHNAVISPLEIMHRHSCNVKVMGDVTVVDVELVVSHSYLIILTVHRIEQTERSDKCVLIGNSVIYNILAELKADYTSEAEAKVEVFDSGISLAVKNICITVKVEVVAELSAFLVTVLVNPLIACHYDVFGHIRYILTHLDKLIFDILGKCRAVLMLLL